MTTSSPERSAQRRSELIEYMSREVLRPRQQFVCRHYRDCLSSCSGKLYYPGQLHHVGPHYDLNVDGEAMRIAVLGLDYGSPDVGINVDQRTSDIIHFGRNTAFGRRNPHMKGTASTLRLLLGRAPGTDAEGERLFGSGDTHIYEAFALLDVVMCSAIDRLGTEGSAPSCATETMKHNCSGHLREALRILDPTVIVIQGRSARAAFLHALGLSDLQSISSSVQHNQRTVQVFDFYHPSAPGKAGWWGQSPQSRYLREVVEPEIKAWARQRAEVAPWRT